VKRYETPFVKPATTFPDTPLKLAVQATLQ